MVGYKKDDEGDDDDPMLLFEGQDDHKVPTHDEVLLGKGMYSVAGRMLQHSIIWGGPGLVGLAQSVKEYIQTGSEFVPLHIDDVPDIEIRTYIQELMDCTAKELSDKGKSEKTFQMLADAGVLRTAINIDNRDIMVQELLLHQIVRCRIRELKQFRDGFDCLSLSKFLQQHPGALEIIFPKQADNVVKYCLVSSLIKFQPRDSPEKKETAKYFIKYLKECELRQTPGCDKDCVTLSKVLEFITGCPVIPPKSYGNISVFFHESQLPIAETCFQDVYIPMGYHGYILFKDAMDHALKSYKGFGLL